MRPRVVIPVALAALAVAGCGGSSAADYTSRVNDVQGRFAADIQQASAETDSAASGAVAAQALDRLADTLGSSAAELRGIDPPEEVAGQHGRLIAALAGLRARAIELARIARSGGQATLVHVQANFIAASSKATAEIAQATDEVNARLGQ